MPKPSMARLSSPPMPWSIRHHDAAHNCKGPLGQNPLTVVASNSVLALQTHRLTPEAAASPS